MKGNSKHFMHKMNGNIKLSMGSINAHCIKHPYMTGIKSPIPL